MKNKEDTNWNTIEWGYFGSKIISLSVTFEASGSISNAVLHREKYIQRFLFQSFDKITVEIRSNKIFL